MNLQSYRKSKVADLPSDIGVYALCDIDQIPIYIGQSQDGIRKRVQRHLTSARSDVIANRQLDVWEIGYVWAWPMPGKSKELITTVETFLINDFHSKQPLMNGKIPATISQLREIPTKHTIQILPDDEIERRKDITLRLPRQVAQFNNLISYILEVKNNDELRRTLTAHFERLQRYYGDFVQNNNTK